MLDKYLANKNAKTNARLNLTTKMTDLKCDIAKNVKKLANTNIQSIQASQFV